MSSRNDLSITQRNIDGVNSRHHRRYGSLKKTLVLWDLSRSPRDNSDLGELLGSGDSAKAMVWSTFDNSTLAAGPFSGLNKGNFTSQRHFNPRNWMLRLHEKNGQGLKVVWDLRLVSDWQNRHDERNNGSTMVMNNCDKASWAWLPDSLVTGLLESGTPVLDKELELDDAALLALVSGNKGKKERGALALNINRRAGFYTDLKLFAHLFHVLHITRLQSLGSTQEEVCGKWFRGQGTLRGDVNWDFAGELGHWVLDERPPETQGRKVTGRFYLGEPDPTPPLKELNQDENSNHPTFLRSIDKGIRCFVEIPIEGVPVPTPGPKPDDFPPVATPGHAPKKNEVGTFDTAEFKPNGKDISVHTSVPIPLDLTTGDDLKITVNFITPAGLGFRGDVDTRVDYVVHGKGDTVSATTLTGSIPATLDRLSFPNPKSEYCKEYCIPYKDLRSSKGGKVALLFVRSGSDDQLDSLNVVDIFYHYAPKRL